MKTQDEIRTEIENLIDTYFSDTTSNRNMFDDEYDPRYYWYDIKDAGYFDDDIYDLEEFNDDLYKSYITWMAYYITDKYLAICPEWLEDKFDYIDDDFDLELSDILDQDDDEKWWAEVKDQFNVNNYLRK